MSAREHKYCWSCGALIGYREAYCPACGEPQPPLPGVEVEKRGVDRRVWVAVVLSFLVTGLGQFYLGRRSRGAAFFLGTVSLGLILSNYLTQDYVMGFGVVMALLSALDAYLLGRGSG